MFINCSNHKSNNWSEAQLMAAREYGEIGDYPFPNVSTDLNREEVVELAEKVADEIIRLAPEAVMCQGEQTLSYHIVRILLEHGIRVVAACTERNTVEVVNADGTVTKTALFNFVKFREY